ncbi:hypothetical protein HELRODRAFT_163547 [Helobdella robusta]|uniref:Uncharacterized protein n=1 Tax=Helobdella robusta TaxID=6412 RepID=T1EU68_HELRO|nr:hypothetical protein HELRODRAFT_163547 [Helobdella robusta]ESN96480.1 hypothetical protein HELRODRAFT_163547 [Helobdella robusta]
MERGKTNNSSENESYYNLLLNYNEVPQSNILLGHYLASIADRDSHSYKIARKTKYTHTTQTSISIMKPTKIKKQKIGPTETFGRNKHAPYNNSFFFIFKSSLLHGATQHNLFMLYSPASILQ